MAGRRAFAALLDQDNVAVLEYQEEQGGFRLVDSRERHQRFSAPDDAADAVVELLAELKAKNATVSIVLQHFGSFFHTLVLPPADRDHLRQIIQREVQRSFNITDPAFAFSGGSSVERRDAARAGGQVPRQTFVAGAPRSVVEAIQARFQKAKVRVEGMTVVPEVFRRLYETLDGSTEATAVLVCLRNGPHVAFFVNGQLELAIEPPLTLEGEAPLDTSVIIDQLERGAIFLRQQARGTVATRLLLAAGAAEYETLASTIEARTGMHVASLGKGIGSPEAVVAMGAAVAARAEEPLDIYPRPPALEERLQGVMTGAGFLTTALLTAAGVAAFWAGMQVMSVRRTSSDLENAQGRVAQTLPALSRARESAQGRERIAGIRSALRTATADRAALVELMDRVSDAPRNGAQLDSLAVTRVADGLKTTLFCHAGGATGPAAMGAATALYRHFKALSGLKSLEFTSEYGSRPVAPTPGSAQAENLRFTVTFLSPAVER